jgi:hypothetical protein
LFLCKLLNRLPDDQAAQQEMRKDACRCVHHCVLTAEPRRETGQKAASSPDLLRADSPQRVSNEVIHQAEEPNHAGHFGMSVKGLLVDPFRVNVENQRITYRLDEMDSSTAGLRAGRLQKAHELVIQLKPFPGFGSKRTNE